MSHPDPRPPAADGEREEGSTFDEALAYIRPHKLTNGDAPVILKAGMLHCCVSAILMREADILSRLTAAEAGREEARADQKAAEDQNDALHVKLKALAPHGSCACSYDQPGDTCTHHSPALVAALARVEKLEKALGVAQSALAMLTEPNEIRSTSVANAWAVAVDAELKCRQALTEAQPKGDQ